MGGAMPILSWADRGGEPVTYTDANPAPRLHQTGCTDWCNHCALCGVGIAFGARCAEHYGVYPENSHPTDSGPAA
jgi:hypothetical protein